MAGNTFRAASGTGLEYNALLTSTREKWHKNGVPQDAIFEAIPTLDALRSKGSFKTEADGGEVIRVSVIKEQNSNGKSYAGYEPANLTPQDEFTIGYDQWRQYSWTTPISGIELFKNSGSQKIFDLLQEKEKVTYKSATEDINKDIWALTAIVASGAGATGNSGKNINSIPLLVQKDPTDGEDVHGIDQSAEAWWRNRAINGDGMTTAQLFIAKMRNAVNTANRGRGGGMADLIIFDQVSFEMFEDALDTKTRYMQTKTASPGFEKIHYKGCECIWDVYVPDTNAETDGGPSTTLTNGSVYVLNSNCLKFYCGKGKDFMPTPFVDGYYNGQDAKVSMTMLYAQLITDSRRNQAVIYDLPSSFTP